MESTVQDHPPPPSEFLLLPPLDSLYKFMCEIRSYLQPGDSRPVMSLSEHSVSQEMMKYWGLWETNMQKSNNSRILHQLVFHTQQMVCCV